MNPLRTATVLTHRRPSETRPAVDALVEIAQAAGAVLYVDPEESRKHRLENGRGLEVDVEGRLDVDICFAFGGDGTILTALRRYAGTGVPVFAVNFGEIGFLATVDREEARSGIEQAFAGAFEVLSLPGIALSGASGDWLAINDVSMHRQPGNRVADLAYAVGQDEIGFLATVDREEARSGIEQAFAGAFEVLSLPGIALSGASGDWLAINDVSMHRQPGNRVADLAYAVGEDEIGRVRCDGLAVATPAGSTGYNLANGGPVMAWGVAGFVVSFIAPHSLTARALVVAPTDVLTVHNRSREESVDVTVDGRPVCTLPPGEEIEAGFVDGQGRLAQLPGANFYHRLREKFGRLSSMR